MESFVEAFLPSLVKIGKEDFMMLSKCENIDHEKHRTGRKTQSDVISPVGLMVQVS